MTRLKKSGLAVRMAGLLLALCYAANSGTAWAFIEAKAPSTLQKGATYVGMDACVACHEDQGRTFKLSSHARLVQKGTENEPQGCETCHGPGSIHAENGGGKGNAIINPRKDPTVCFTCHRDKKMQFRLPNHHPVLEGKMSCSDCHELHGPDAKVSLTSLEGPNDVCFKCHKDQQGPFVYEHPALRDGCQTCHNVHGSVNEKMLLARDFNLCLKCHAQSSISNTPNTTNIGDHDHSNDFQRSEACWTCHTRPHGSNFAPRLTY